MRSGTGDAGGAPPLWLWLGVAAATLGLLAASLPAYFASEVTDLELSRAARRERLQAFAREVAAEPRPLTAVALGDSSLRYATYADDEMEAYWRATVGVDAQFLRISQNGATLETFLDLLDDILELRPDVLILQEDLLRRERDTSWEAAHRAFQRGEPPPPAFDRRQRMRLVLTGEDPFRHQQFFARHYLRGLGIGRFADEDWSRRMARRERRGRCAVEERAANLRHYRERYPRGFDHRMHPLMAASAAALIDRAARAGVAVVIAGIPFGGPMGRDPGVQTRLASIREFTADPVRRDRVRHWRPAAQPPPDHYCDWNHLSEVGRDAWSRWLGERLAALVGGGALP